MKNFPQGMEKITLTQHREKLRGHCFYKAQCWATPIMVKLADEFKDSSNISFRVDLIEPGYHYSESEIPKGGIYQYCSGDPYHDYTDKFPENVQTLVCKIILSAEQYPGDKEIEVIENNVKNLVSLLNLQKGGRNNIYDPLSISNHARRVEKTHTYYICKKPGFDDAYQKLKILMPELKETEMIGLNFHNQGLPWFKGCTFLSFNPDIVYADENSENSLMSHDHRRDFFIMKDNKRVYDGQDLGYTIDTYYVHKKPGFDDAYQSLKTMIPDLEETDMITLNKLVTFMANLSSHPAVGLYNSNLVDISTSDNNSIKSIERVSQHYEFTHRSIDISILSTDIEPNFELLCKILRYCSNENK
jgi:hypothetical protein